MKATARVPAHSRKGMPLALIALGALLPAVTGAGVWTLEPQLSTSADYSSNPQLRESPQSGHSAALLGGLPVAWDDGAQHIDLAPSVRIAKADGDYYSNTNAYYVASSGTLQDERATLKATVRWAKDSTVLLEPTTGTLTRLDLPRRTEGASAEAQVNLSLRSSLDITVSNESVGYSGGLPFGIYDYKDQSVQATLSHAWTERRQLELVVGGSSYDAGEIGFTSRDSYAQFGLVEKLTARWTVTALAGVSQASMGGGPQESPRGGVYQLSLKGISETGALTLSAARVLQPSAYGTMVKSTNYTAQGSWRDSERGSVEANVRVAHTSDVFGTVSFATQSYVSGSVVRAWRATPEWTVAALVGWQRARLNPEDTLGRGWSTSLTLTRKFGKVRV